MKPEPLKDKELYDGLGKALKRFSKNDIKSAVEWLKERINNKQVSLPIFQREIEITELIDKAFEDVTGGKNENKNQGKGHNCIEGQ